MRQQLLSFIPELNTQNCMKDSPKGKKIVKELFCFSYIQFHSAYSSDLTWLYAGVLDYSKMRGHVFSLFESNDIPERGGCEGSVV